MRVLPLLIAALAAAAVAAGSSPGAGGGQTRFVVQEYRVPAGSRPHDVAPARDGGVWYTAQGSGELGWLNPKSGRVRETALARDPRDALALRGARSRRLAERRTTPRPAS